MSVMFTVHGQPKGKDRPRFKKQGRTYTSDATKQYESEIKAAYLSKGVKGKFNAGTPVKMEIVAFYGIPKNDKKDIKEKKKSGEILPTIKSDIDNVCKIFADALNGLAYDDDKQITHLVAAKRYDENPRVIVRISEVKENDGSGNG